MTHADWLILGYTTVIIIFGIVSYQVSRVKAIFKPVVSKNHCTRSVLLAITYCLCTRALLQITYTLSIDPTRIFVMP